MNARRLLLTRLTKLLVLIGIGFALYPFIAGLLPEASVDDQRRQHWMQSIDVTDLQPGDLRLVSDWPGGPVAIYRRTAHEIDALHTPNDQLHDPDSRLSVQPADLATGLRSHTPELFVFIPAETERGCQVRVLPANKQPRPDLRWFGGFTEPCLGSLYDTAGRVYRDHRAARQQNLRIPPYRIGADGRVALGLPGSGH